MKVENLRVCFDCTNWEIFHDGTLDEKTEVINDYINFCVQLVIPTKNIKVYPNNKSYITKDIKEIINRWNVAFRNKDPKEIKVTEKELKSKMRKAKEAHRQCLEETFRPKNNKKVWDTIKTNDRFILSLQMYCNRQTKSALLMN